MNTYLNVENFMLIFFSNSLKVPNKSSFSEPVSEPYLNLTLKPNFPQTTRQKLKVI